MSSDSQSSVGIILSPAGANSLQRVYQLLEQLGMEVDVKAMQTLREEMENYFGKVEWIGVVAKFKETAPTAAEESKVMKSLLASDLVQSAGPMLNLRDFWNAEVFLQIKGSDTSSIQFHLDKIERGELKLEPAPGGMWCFSVPPASALSLLEEVKSLKNHPDIQDVIFSYTRIYLENDQ